MIVPETSQAVISRTVGWRGRSRVEAVGAGETVEILGVRIPCLRTADVLTILAGFMRDNRARSVYFINAATLNLAYEDPAYRAVLNRGDLVLNDGTGVRWAARRQGVWLSDNHVGTDLVPRLCEMRTSDKLRVYLLGGPPSIAARAGVALMHRYSDLMIVGARDGQFRPMEEDAICAEINACEPTVVLVGLGNPLQELWIERHLKQLKRGVILGVGGLFHYLAGTLTRAPLMVRRAGCEWLHILLQQPHKWKRYILGDPLFLYRMWSGKL